MDDPRPAPIHSLSRRHGGRIAGAAAPARARPARLHKRMSPKAAFSATLSDCLLQITANAAILRAGRSVEALHQLRVGLRRLDVALNVFGKAFGQPWFEELRGRAKVLSSRIAPARDLDVLLEDLIRPAGLADLDGSLSALAEAAGAARESAWEEAQGVLAGKDFGLFLDDIAALAQSQLPLAPPQRLKAMAAAMLARQCRRAQKRGRKARSGREGDLHRLRIALKKLRYTAEFFAPLFGRKTVRRYLRKVKHLQDCLGRLNDIAVARGSLGALAPKDGAPALRHGAGLLQGWYQARRPRLVRKALRRWHRFEKQKPFWA